MYRDSVNNKPVNPVLWSCALAFFKTDIDNFLSCVVFSGRDKWKSLSPLIPDPL